MIRRDDLEYQGLILYQDDEQACFSADAVALVNFLRLSARDRAVDLGAGNGVISILGAAKTGAAFTGVEIQPALVALAQRSAKENAQDIAFCCADVADAPTLLGHGAFTAAVMNPPYFSSGEESQNASRAAARHGGMQTLEPFLHSAFLLLRNGGRLFICYPAESFVDLVCALRRHRLEPKRLRPACTESGVPKRILIEAKKDGRPGLIWEAASPI